MKEFIIFIKMHLPFLTELLNFVQEKHFRKMEEEWERKMEEMEETYCFCFYPGLFEK